MQFSIETSIIVGFTALALKLVEYLYSYAKEKLAKEETIDKKIKRLYDDLADIKSSLQEIEPIFSRVDESGTNLLYFPRRYLAQQDNMSEHIRENGELLRRHIREFEIASKTLDKLTSSLEGIAKVLDKLENRSVACPR